MVKYFSADWLAQSHHSTTGTQQSEAGTASARTHRPHIPCMVQPFAPVYGKGYLQPKSNASNPTEKGEFGKHPDSSLSPLRPENCPSPLSEVSGYSSGYDSEAAECLSVEDRSGVDKDAPQRRVRTKFTPKQILKLEKVFSKHRYLDAGERVKTARKLNLTETQVRTWFQNRRMKLKREVQDHFAPQMPVLNFRALPQVQYLSVDAQRQHTAAVRAFYAPPQLVLQQQMTTSRAPHVLIHHQHFF
ncbi:Homeobox protein vent1 [Oryzias melastigma]|uniref:Homeobox protein vent1 n=1 Tax=Oryzias melastigma TaxID=30732 RepID=A0A834L0K6_ORYME|nr:homeobox protein vent1 [Oryzias melastigma]KAF6737470.1 Homeobox protein vent1 [Oryzias melastigma]